ncbi:MAG TPA: hypothetical protein VFB29_13295 [Pseudolabrys sp.]|nr:hypothetical protein [Pseudolabrys sp.]
MKLICLIPAAAPRPDLWAFQCTRCGHYKTIAVPDFSAAQKVESPQQPAA